MNIDRTIRDLQRLESAVEDFKDIVGRAQTFGPDSLPQSMACGEANVFAELLDALGIPEEASALREWHLFYDEDVEKIENHPDWS